MVRSLLLLLRWLRNSDILVIPKPFFFSCNLVFITDQRKFTHMQPLFIPNSPYQISQYTGQNCRSAYIQYANTPLCYLWPQHTMAICTLNGFACQGIKSLWIICVGWIEPFKEKTHFPQHLCKSLPLVIIQPVCKSVALSCS